MAIFRNVNMSFWTDPKVVDDYTPEDRYFMLYALTNNYTNIIGCYEISIKQMSNDLGYTKDVIENLLNRFKEVHKTIDYDFDTKELMVINWNKYNWSSSPKLDSPLYTAIESVKSDLFHDKLATIYNNRESVNEKESKEDIVLIPYRYGIDTTITITNTIPITNSISNTNIAISSVKDDIPYKEIIDYLNMRSGSNYRHTTNKTKDLIKARFNESIKSGNPYTLDNFKEVIDKKCVEWMNTDMQKYLRPETLFGTKFESYLNQQMKERKVTTKDLTIDISDF